MPFTLAHPAAVLPFIKRNNINVTALVLGSMAPDFEYFLRFEPVGLFGHSLGGFLYFNLPLCFVIAYVFHFVVKKTFIACLPHPIDKWFWNVAVKEWGLNNVCSVWVFVYSSLLGMVTHVLWDSFTHQSGWFVKQIPILVDKIYIGTIAVPLFKILQHGSTLLGLTILMVFCYSLRNRQIKVQQVLSVGIKVAYFGSVIMIGAICLCIFFLYTKSSGIGAYIITFLDGLILGTIVASLVVKNVLYCKKYKVDF